MPSSISSRLRSRSRPRGARSSAISDSLCDSICTARRPLLVVGLSRGSGLQATLASGIGQRLDAAVVTVARAVEGDLLDAGLARLARDRGADLGGGLGVLAVLQALAHVGLGGAGRRQDLRAVGGEQLRVQVLAGAQHRQ